MIRAFLSDTSVISKDEALGFLKSLECLSRAFCRIEGDEARRQERASSYLALWCAYKRLYPSRDMPPLFFTEEGQPHILGDTRLFVSLSHRPGVALVAISDEPVGADLEEIFEGKRERMAEISKRTGLVLPGNPSPEYKLETLDLKMAIEAMPDGKYTDFDNDSLQIADFGADFKPWLEWTTLEAVLKLSGGGFGNFERRAELATRSAVASVRVEAFGRNLAISIAKWIG